jgi:putative ABC transport system permease protein
MIPAIFLAVAAFLVNIVVSRLVFLERTQIAVLKALGYSNRRVARHYLTLVALVVAISTVVGVASGYQTSGWMTNLYSDFYRFPTRLHHVSAGLVGVTTGIGLAAAVLGALSAIRRIARLPPAQAMRPPAPLVYRQTMTDRLRLDRVLGPASSSVGQTVMYAHRTSATKVDIALLGPALMAPNTYAMTIDGGVCYGTGSVCPSTALTGCTAPSEVDGWPQIVISTGMHTFRFYRDDGSGCTSGVLFTFMAFL